MDKGTATVAAPSGPRIIERPRLTKILDESDARIILLIAPAGYGKTTLARQWLKDKPHVWYQATAASADPVALARDLEVAFGLTAPSVGIERHIRDNPALAADIRAMAALLAESLSGHREDVEFIAIDDYHHLSNIDDAGLLIDALAQAPYKRLVLASRTEVDLASARHIVYGHALRVGMEHLAFDREEITRVFSGPVPPSQRANPEAFRWPLLATLAAKALLLDDTANTEPGLLYEFL